MGRPTLLRSSRVSITELWQLAHCVLTRDQPNQEPITGQTKSFSSDDLGETWVRAVEKTVSNVVFPRDIVYFTQHKCIRTIELFLQRFCQ